MPNQLHQLPVAAGIGLRMPHIQKVLDTRPDVAWWEVHAENFFGGGANLAALDRIRADWPISLHGVGLGLGNAEPLRQAHLSEWKQLIDRVEPAAISEHLCWNAWQNDYFNDLLPLPYSEAALAHMIERVGQVQHALGRPLLVENLSSYVAFPEDVIPEGEFLAELARRTGCGLLVDINNLYVNERNLGRDAKAAIDALPVEAVAEIHIAGFETRDDGLLIDTHGAPVCEPVWALLDYAYQRFGPVPTLLERDTSLPALESLLQESGRAATLLASHQTIQQEGR
ncbi:hypothetical protein HNQ59_002992 [Chitinivorax tropicus]|uniref:UPF0276 protein HNQ59_002992 n=1 Tax=Chitinivorax tropicus TaxID=714531 RepID=A0A840MKH3_9PROT|nr:DUF692 domain-containing protein [Chitinivorax tropicus]MBB5019684.1 hypothetical protein [Chitinivorax tropicus]